MRIYKTIYLFSPTQAELENFHKSWGQFKDYKAISTTVMGEKFFITFSYTE